MAVKFFGQYLVEQGIVSRDAIVAAIELQDRTNLKLGEMALAMGLVTAADIERAHQAQLSRDMRLGDLLVCLGMLSAPQLDQIVARQKETHLYIGEALVQTGGLSREELERSLAAFKLDQAPYVAEQVELPPGMAHADIWGVAVDLSYKMVTRVLGLRFRPGTSRAVERIGACHMAAAMDLGGEVRGRYLLAVSAEVQRKVARAILHEDSVEGEPVEVLEDSVMEFVNVVCGNVAAIASQAGTHVKIDPPVALHPPAEGLELPRGHAALCFPIHFEDGESMDLYLVVPR